MTISTAFDSRTFLRHCSRKPGVYRMFDAAGKILYVGKARDLKARLSNYFQKQVGIKTAALVAKIHHIETTVTQSEIEALLLEQTLIKQLAPPYNILLRDDKSYPYIRIDLTADFPRADLHRGARTGKARYFGPYPSAGSVRDVLNLMEKAFQLRNCSDTFFRNRTRPCLQYQIGRCTAPCVGLVSKAQYRQQVEQAIAFLEGRDSDVVEALKADMDRAAVALDYERAAVLRDRLAAIQEVRQRQYVDTGGQGNLDVVAVASAHGLVVIELLMVRGGRVLGNRSIHPRNHADSTPEEVLVAFVEQHYLTRETSVDRVDEVLLDRDVPEADLLAEALSQQWQRKVRVASRVRGERQGFVRLASANAENALRLSLSQSDNLKQRFGALAALLDCPVPARIECFDISHTGGKQAIAACVVAVREEGLVPGQYRKFNVTPDHEGDDYAALAEAIGRRYKRVTAEQGVLPDILLLDGGKGQVSRIKTLLESLELDREMLLLGISEGAGKKALMNALHFPDGSELVPAPDDPGFLLLQQIRDETHRFAITSHRAKRAKTSTHSKLEDIPGIGPKRRRELLRHFGGLQGLRNASVEDLGRVEGINATLAASIHDHLHGD